ncbi:MAG: hypothetical protein ACKO3N_14405 [Verrucomicrobiota bacterium]
MRTRQGTAHPLRVNLAGSWNHVVSRGNGGEADAEFHHFAMVRHGKGIQLVFFDGSARAVRTRGLWQLPWHRQFDVEYHRRLRFPAWMP